MASPTLPGLFWCFIALVFLIIISVSAPVWNHISFLNVTAGAQTVHFGVFGYTGSARGVGYHIDSAVLGLPDTKLDSGALHNLTFVLVLHPIAAGLAALAFLFGLCAAAYPNMGFVMTLATVFAALTTFIVWIVDLALWGIARNHMRAAGASAQYGNANWLTLCSITLLLCACGSYRWRREKM